MKNLVQNIRGTCSSERGGCTQVHAFLKPIRYSCWIILLFKAQKALPGEAATPATPEEEEEEEEEGQVLPVRQAGRADAKKKKTSNIVSLRSDEGVHKKSKHQLWTGPLQTPSLPPDAVVSSRLEVLIVPWIP